MYRLLTITFLAFFSFFGAHSRLWAQPEADNVTSNANWLSSSDERYALSEQELQWLKEEHTVRVRVSYWPPYMIQKPEPSGIAVDYIKFIATRYGINIQLTPATHSWSQSLEDLRTERKYYDLILTMNPTQERKQIFALTEPYLRMPWVIFTAQDRQFIGSIDDLKGKTVAVERDFVMYSKLKNEYPEIKLNVVDDSLSAIKSIAVRGSVAYIGNLGNSTYLIREHGFDNVRIVAPTPFNEHAQSMAVRNDWPELASIVTKGFQRMTQKERDDIKNQWLSVRYDHGIRFWDVAIGILSLFVVAGTIICVIVRSNNKLNSEIERRGKVEKELEKYIQVVDKNVMIVKLDENGIIEKVSEAFCKTCEYHESELVGYSYQLVLSQDIDPIKKADLCNAISEKKTWAGEFQVLSKHSKEVWVSATLSSTQIVGQQSGYTFILQNISDRKKVELLSITDKLTGLYNRLKLEEVLALEIQRAQRYGSVLSISMIDIDHFKDVNDTYGHRAGDVVLESLARILKESLRKTDTVGRWGGEEFLIICPQTSIEGCSTLVEKLRTDIEHHYFNGIGYKTASFGVTSIQEEDSLEDIVNRADKALYLAKDKGRNCVVSI